MNPIEAGGYAIGAVTGLFLLLLAARHAWHHFNTWAARKLEHIMADALDTTPRNPTPNRWDHLDAEYRLLVIQAHKDEQ